MFTPLLLRRSWLWRGASRTFCRRRYYRPVLEPLEDRTLPSVSITGMIFQDLLPTTGLAGITAYLDLNQNGVLDSQAVAVAGDTEIMPGTPLASSSIPAGGFAPVTVSDVPDRVTEIAVTLDISNTGSTPVIVGLFSPTGAAVQGGTAANLYSGSILIVLGANESFGGTLSDQATLPVTLRDGGGNLFRPEQAFDSPQAHIYGNDPNGDWGLVFFPAAAAANVTIHSWTLTLTVAEPSVQSGPNGIYTFSDLEPGTYDVRVVLPPAAVATTPASGLHQVTVAAGQSVANVNFGIQAAPDLAPASLRLVQPPGDWGEEVTLEYLLVNRGPAAAGPFAVDVRLSTNGVIDDSDPVLATIEVEGLAAFSPLQGSVTLQLPLSPPAGFGPVSAAFLGLVLDARGQVVESNETNNLNQGADVDIVALASPQNTALTSEDAVQQMPTIAVNPNDPDNVIVAFLDYGLLTTGFAGIALMTSHDGGRSWQRQAIPLPAGFDEAAGHPVARFDADGRVYVTFMAVEFLGPGTPPLIYFPGTVNVNGVNMNGRALGMQANNGVFIVRSDDGGTTWTAPMPVTSNVYTGPTDTLTTPLKVPFDTLPDIAIDTFRTLPDGQPNPNFGNIYATWTRFYPAGQIPSMMPSANPAPLAASDIMFAVSRDGGLSWTVSVDGNGASLVREPFIGGRPAGVADGAAFTTISRLSVGPEGDVYVSSDLAGFFGVFRTPDAGASFVPPTVTFVLASLHGLAFGGTTGNRPAASLYPEGFRTISSRAIVADPLQPGRVYVVEAMPVLNPNRVGIRDSGQIYFAVSDDYGTTWRHIFSTAGQPSNFDELLGAQQNDFRSSINDDNGGRYIQFVPELEHEVISGQALPELTIDANGNIAVIWYDTRRDPLNRRLDVFGAFSTDGGASFSSNYRISDVTFNPNDGAIEVRDAANNLVRYIGDRIGLAFANGVVYAAWTDTRDGQQDIFFARFEIPPGLAPGGDRFEPNDTAATATDLGQVSLQRLVPALSLTPGDEDWFKVTAAATGDLRIAATGSHTLQLELWNADGTTLLGSGTEIRDTNGALIGRQINRPAAAGQSFLIRVSGQDVPLEGVSYSLILSSLTEDLGSSVHGERSRELAPGASDVFALTAALAGSLELELQASAAEVTLTVLNADGLSILASGNSISLPVEAGQTVLLRVAGATTPANYTLAFTNLDRFQTQHNGAFAFPVSGTASSIAVGDLNGDGHPDIVSSSNLFADVVNVLLGNGDGTFQAARTFAVGAGLNTDSTRAILLHDFNGDGVLDIAVSNFNSADVSILLGRGDGTFEPQRRVDALALPDGLAVGDFNGDGVADLVVLQRSSEAPRLAVLIGNGAGTFKPPLVLTSSMDSTAFPVRVADVDGDGRDDILVFGVNTARFQVLLSNGDGTFRDGGEFAHGEITLEAVLADINGDGHVDVITGAGNQGVIFLMLGNGDGTFQAPQSFVVTPPRPSENIAISGLVVGDYGSAAGLGQPDGQLDIIATSRSRSGATPPQVVLLAGLTNAQGAFVGFAPPRVIANPTTAGKPAAGDFNGDGILDVAVAEADGIRVIFGAKPTIAPNTTLASARDLGVVVHLVNQPIAVVPGFQDQYFKITVPSEASPFAGSQVLDFSALFQHTSGQGLGMEVLDAQGNSIQAGERLRLVAEQGEVLFVRIFGKGTSALGTGMATLIVNVLPQVIQVQPGSLVPGGGVTSLVVTLQGDRLDPEAAEDPDNYVVRWFGPDNQPDTADDALIPLALGEGMKAVIYNPGANIEVSSGRTFPTAVRQTITLLFDRALPSGVYQIEIAAAVTTADVFAGEAELLASAPDMTGHAVVHRNPFQINEGGRGRVLVAPSGDVSPDFEAFESGTPFLTQLHNDLGAQLDQLLNSVGDDPGVSGEITSQILARMLPAADADGLAVSYLVIWLDPVSIDLADPGGNRAVFDLQSNTVSNTIARTFVEVGGNVQLLVIAAASGTFTLNVDDVQPTARGGAVVITPGQVSTVSLTDAMRGGESAFTFSFPSVGNPGGSPGGLPGTSAPSAFSAPSPLTSTPTLASILDATLAGVNEITLTLGLATAVLEATILSTASIDAGAPGVGGSEETTTFVSAFTFEAIVEIVDEIRSFLVADSFLFSPEAMRSLALTFEIPLRLLGLEEIGAMFTRTALFADMIDATLEAARSIANQVWTRFLVFRDTVARLAEAVPAPLPPAKPEEQEELEEDPVLWEPELVPLAPLPAPERSETTLDAAVAAALFASGAFFGALSLGARRAEAGRSMPRAVIERCSC